MLRKWNRILSFILAIALVATTFHSDLATIRVFADGDIAQDVVEVQPQEPVVEEPVVEEPVVEEPAEEPAEPEYVEAEPEEPAPEDVIVTEEGTDPEVEVVDPEAPEAVEDPEAVEPKPVAEPEKEDPKSAVTLSDEEIAAIIEGLTEEGLAALEGQYSAEDFAAIKKAFEEKNKAAEEEAAPVQKLVTVSYNASLGGKVSKAGETIDINDAEAKFEGATATAVNKYYQFVAWVDANGNTVSSDSTFVPSNIEEDTTFTANFMKLSSMPAQSFSGSAGGMNVSVSADEGIFPEGTTMHVSAISDDEALDAAKDAIGESAQTAKGVDITFRNADGEEIEPADSRYVHVSISLASALEGESFSVVHKDNSGNADVIASANADGAEFEANSFSVYIVAGSGDSSGDDQGEVHATSTYIFKVGDTEYAKQVLKAGEELYDPGIPTLGKDEEFLGWYNGNEKVTFGVVEKVKADEVITITAKIETTYYVSFIGVDKEVVYVEKLVVPTGGSTVMTLDYVKVTPKEDYQAFEGWSPEKDATEPVTSVDASVVKEVYAVIVNAYWIHFDENDGGAGGGASYTGPVFVKENETADSKKPADPTRVGYTFGGWYENKGDGDGKVTGEPFDWTSHLTENITLYAKWTANPTTTYTVILWQQKITDSKNTTDNAAKTYDFKESFEVEGVTGKTIGMEEVNSYIGSQDKGFHYSWYDAKRNNKGTIVDTNEIRAKGDTILNIYFDRDEITITFKYRNNGSWADLVTPFKGLYGQTLAFNGYTWPSNVNSNNYNWYTSYSKSGSSYSGSGTHVTFLDTFLETETLYGFTSGNGSYKIRHYKQDLNGLYSSQNPTNETSEKAGTWNFTQKYDGFNVKEYYLGKNYPSGSGSWTATSAGSSVYYENNLYIHYERLKYSLTFEDTFDGISTVKTIDDIYFEQNLAGYEDQAPTMPSKPGYTFKGWYEDQSGTKPFNWNSTMPAANKVIYAYYQVDYYKIHLDPDGGTLIPTQSADFTLPYHEIVDRTSLYSTTKDGYHLVGWFDADTDYAYGFPEVEKDTNLVAKWRFPGTVNVVYNAGEHGSRPPVDEYNYAGSSTVVVGAPPKEVESGYTFIGWTIDNDPTGKVYYPNNSFEIKTDYVSDKKVTLTANYIKTGGIDGPTTYITYNANGGVGADVTINTLLVNESVIALTHDEAGFSREGYEFLGWSRTSGDDNKVDFAEGERIAADNDKLPNILYAVWKRLQGTYEIQYYKGEVTVPSDTAHFLGRTDPVTVKAGTEITLTDTQLNANRPSVGYGNGVQQRDVPYIVEPGDGNVIYVLYSPVQITVTVEGIQETKVYDGEPLTVTGFRVTDITPGTGYKAEYVAYDGETDISATHVSESKEIPLNGKFTNTSSDFDSSAITFVLGDVQSNKVTITPATLTVTTPDASKVYDGTPLTAEGTISGFVKDETATFTTTGTITTPGEVTNAYTLEWNGTAKEDDYTVSESLGTLKITESTAAITVTTVGGEFVYDGSERGATVTVSKLPEGYTLEAAESSAKATDVTTAPVAATADTLIIKNAAGEDVTSNLNITKIDGSITITPAPITIVTPSATKVYDGTALTAEGDMTGLVNGETATFKTTGTQTKVGTSDNTYSLTWDGTAKESNYKITSETIGTLTVTESDAEIVVTTTGGTFGYDGTAHGATVTVSELPAGYRLDKAASSATATDVTTAPVAATADTLVIRNAAGEDVTSKLKIRYVDGTIEVTPAKLTIVTPDAEKTYDGEPLTAEGTISGFVNGDTATFTTTGTITDVGEEPNSYELKWDGTAKESNYVLDETIGTLKVTEFAGEIEVVTTGGEFEYNAEAHGATVEVNGLPKGYTVGTAVSNATATDVTEEDVPATCDELVILNAKGEDVTAALTITKKDGFIRIIPAKVTVNIKGDQKSFKYNGQEQKAEGYEVAKISNPLYKESEMSFAGEAIAKGKTPDTYPMNLKAEQFKNNNKNFEVTFDIEDGSLTIEPLGPGEEFRIYATAIDAERDYTGNYYDGFRYELRGEGPTQNIIIEAAGRAVEFFREMFAPIKADADDGESSDPTVTINGVEFTVRGLSVPTRERNAGEYELPIVGDMQVFDGDVNVTDQFVLVERNSGKLTIYPMVINLTSGSATKVYDGTPLTNSNITADKDWGVGDTVRYDITGSQTAVGSSDNVFVAVGVDDTDLDTNYRINYKYGTLTVTSAPTPPTPPTPPGGGTTITDDPTPTAPTPLAAPPAAVLGATRETDGAAVLGARRGRTDDKANVPGRIFAVLVAAAVATALLLTRKKEEEEDK